MAANGYIFTQGFDEAADELELLANSVEDVAMESLKTTMAEVENLMKNNAASVFTDGYTKGVMVDSISSNVTVKDGQIFASVGVYDMSNKTGSSDRVISGRRISEPLIAFFYETGIRPHSTAAGARLAHPSRGKERGQTGKLHRGSPPRPFLSSAFDQSGFNIFNTLKLDLSQLVDKI